MSNDVTLTGETPNKVAARVREHRRRRREDLVQVTIEIDRFVIGQLEANGYLEDARDGSKLADAVELFISDHMPQSEPA